MAANDAQFILNWICGRCYTMNEAARLRAGEDIIRRNPEKEICCFCGDHVLMPDFIIKRAGNVASNHPNS